MRNKIKIILLLVFGITLSLQAQLRQSDTTYYRSIIPTEKQSLLSNVDLIANMQYGYRSDFSEGNSIGSKFKMEQFRMETKGWVTDRVFFRFRHRFTSSFEPQSVDKIIKGVDLAFITVKLDEKWQLTLGKTYADWGGIEFDLNPINVYEYSDIIEEADNFLSGAGLYYKTNDKHSFGLQVLNPRTQNFEEIYQVDTIIGLLPEQAKSPLAGVITWRGNFADGKFTTVYSYSLFKEAKDNFKNYFAFGNLLNLGKTSIAYDYKLSIEDIDRTGIITREINNSPTFSGNPISFTFADTRYESHWVNVTHKFSSQWRFSLTGFVDFAHTKVLNSGDFEKIRTAYGYVPSIEYFPWDDLNMKFFIGYVGRIIRYTDEVKRSVLLEDTERSRLVLGFSSPLKVL